LLVRLLPRIVRERLTASFMQRLAGGGGYASLEELLPAMRYDFAVVGEMIQQVKSFRSLEKPVLLLGGTRGPSYLKAALRELSRVLPRARRTTLPGLDHSGPWNKERGGSPLRVAEAITGFLLQPRD
jgi:pimeloyl-ACP methyl ester carboxylesterase